MHPLKWLLFLKLIIPNVSRDASGTLLHSSQSKTVKPLWKEFGNFLKVKLTV